MTHDDGGPAFPGKHEVYRHGDGSVMHAQDPGMTLRDWFAGQALAGLMSQPKAWAEPHERMALDAYDAADAMMRERAK